MEDPAARDDPATAYLFGKGGMAAILELTKSIKLDPSNASLYVQRSEVFRQVEQYYHAVKDAEKAVSLKPEWYKGYYCKGQAELGAEHFKEAVLSFEAGLAYSSQPELVKAVQKANRAWFMSRINDRSRTLKGLLLGCVVGGLALATNDFVLPTPLVKNIFLKVFLFGLWGYFGMESAKQYTQTLIKDRERRLEAPEDLFPFGSGTGPKQKAKPATASHGTGTDDVMDSSDASADSSTRQRHKAKTK